MQLATRKSSVSRDFILLFAVLMMIIAIVAVWVAYKTFENYADGVVSEMEGEAIRIDRSLIVEIKTASYLLESLARQIIQTGPDQHEKIARLLSSFYDNNNNRHNEFSWLDTSQEVIINSRIGILDKPINASDRDYVKKALSAPWQVHVGRPITGRVSERWILPLSLGVTDYKGNFAGIIMLSLDIEHLAHELREVVKESGMEFSIFSKTLTLIADSGNMSEKDIYTEGSHTQLGNINLTEKRKGLLSRPDLFQPSAMFSYYEVSSQYPYIVYIDYNQTENNDRIFSLLQARLIQILIISVFLLTLLWMVRTRIIRPVEKLSEVTAGISAGMPYRPLPRGGPMEIENLANQIRKLSDYISEQHRIQQELKLKNQFLNRIKDTAQILTRVRSEFLASASQELQKPLKRVSQKLQKLIEYQRSGKLSKESLEDVMEVFAAINHLQQMIDDMKQIAEVEYSSLHLRDNTVNISFAMHRALRHFHDYPQYRHIDVKLKAADDLPPILIDEDRFTQIILNILCGAAANLMQGTSIELSAQIEYNQNISRELVVQLKYASNMLLPAFELLAQPDNDVLHRQTDGSTPRIKSDIICFALAKMLISIYDGEMTIGTIKNDISRVFLRFPGNRLLD